LFGTFRWKSIFILLQNSTPVPLEFTAELIILKAEFCTKLLSSYCYLKYSSPHSGKEYFKYEILLSSLNYSSPV
jgi:hypothetical protein